MAVSFRTLRRRAGFSQHSLAATTRRQVRQETISQIERGDLRDPRGSKLLALSTALGEHPAAVFAAIRSTPRRRVRRAAT